MRPHSTLSNCCLSPIIAKLDCERGSIEDVIVIHVIRKSNNAAGKFSLALCQCPHALHFEFHSEFCKILNSVGKCYHSDQNHVPRFHFSILIRIEAMYLDRRCDIRMGGSCPEGIE